jgi:hypothetical protein
LLQDVFKLAVTAEAGDTISTTYAEALKAKELKSRELLTTFITIAPQTSPPTAAELQEACQKLQSDVCFNAIQSVQLISLFSTEICSDG